jgi:glycosyltransferase involved in cell wall biosynthesis
MASWAKVSRELLKEMVRQGDDVSFREVTEDRHDPRIRLPRSLAVLGRLDDPRPAGVVATYLPPDYYDQLPGGIRVGFLNNESTLWPPSWVAKAKQSVDAVAVASKFEVETLSQSGLPTERILRITPGVDPEVYFPAEGGRPKDRFVVQFVGVQAWRKGLDLLVLAFQRAFAPSDDVELRLKLAYYPDEASRPHLYSRWRNDVAMLRRSGYTVHFSTRFFEEWEMRDLYRRCHVVCCPTRGDGFCLPLLEAMACQTPVIGTRWSGPAEYLDEIVGVPLTEFEFVPERKLNPWSGDGHPEALVAEPCLDELTHALRWAYEHPEELAARGRQASVRARMYTWKAAVQNFWGEIERRWRGCGISGSSDDRPRRWHG